jgi:predicted nucleic acid-binding protein
MNAVDTNVLIYVRDPRDAAKQEKAVRLTTGLTDGALLWQVACEFVAASRKLAPFGFTQAQAWHEVTRWRALWQLVLPSENVLNRAQQLTALNNLSFWDAMIVAACMEGGVARLYTEDFDDSLSQATGVEIVNPFSVHDA